MGIGDYVQDRRDRFHRGEVVDVRGVDVLVYTRHETPLKQLWWAREDELIRLLRKGD